MGERGQMYAHRRATTQRLKSVSFVPGQKNLSQNDYPTLRARCLMISETKRTDSDRNLPLARSLQVKP